MKRLWLLSLLLLAGCHVETETPPVKPPEQSTEPVVQKEPNPPGKPIQNTVKLRHPDRVYQLAQLNRAKLTANGTELDVWVMNDDGKRTEGMMFLKPGDVKDREGMIFIFPEVRGEDYGFWMQNTFIPLDVIYINSDSKVVSIGKGQPLNESTIYPKGKYQYVLELKQGMSAKLGIKPGTEIKIPAELKAEG